MRAAAVLLISLFLFTSPAWALSLEEAKQHGLVGEQASGYLAAVSPPSAEVQQLLTAVNSRRKEEYAKIAESNGTPVAAVEALAGKKAIDRTPSGQYVNVDGQWKKK
jgi:uncharacterized protein YdbL (DUF1318 family)